MTLLAVTAFGVIIRQCFVLAAVVRSARFLRRGRGPIPPADDGSGPTFFIVVPMLRETAIVADTVRHMQAMAEGHSAQVIIVTTAREAAKGHATGAAATASIVGALAAGGKLVHLHYPDPSGLKADQLKLRGRPLRDHAARQHPGSAGLHGCVRRRLAPAARLPGQVRGRYRRSS
jgi:hypothetical protein